MKPSIFLYTLLYFLAAGASSQTITCNWKDNTDVARDIFIKVYKGDKSNPVSTNTTADKPEGIIQDINSTLATIFYIHGFQESSKSNSVKAIIEAYLQRGDVNTIIVDWGKLAANIYYPYVAQLVRPVGKVIAECLQKLADVINLKTVHVIGHSLGAHVAGFIGKYMNGTLSRLTALDPAFPAFYPSSCHVSPKDAAIVNVLHTNNGYYGTPFNTGSIDFHANRERQFQPGCPIVGIALCSHLRAVDLYAESVNNPKAFPGHKCYGGETATGNKNEIVYFGDTTPNVRGVFCFKTGSKPPYAKLDAK